MHMLQKPTLKPDLCSEIRLSRQQYWHLWPTSLQELQVEACHTLADMSRGFLPCIPRWAQLLRQAELLQQLERLPTEVLGRGRDAEAQRQGRLLHKDILQDLSHLQGRIAWSEQQALHSHALHVAPVRSMIVSTGCHLPCGCCTLHGFAPCQMRPMRTAQ